LTTSAQQIIAPRRLAAFATLRLPGAIDNNWYEPAGTSVVLFAVAMGFAGLGILVYLIGSSGVAPASYLP
jgi:hypothetical protein